MQKIIQTYFKTLSVVSPRLAAHSAFEMFKKVRKKEIRDREKPFFIESKHSKIKVEGEEIHVYEFGNPKNDLVILVHGWDSNAGSMYRFVQPLLDKNKYVVGFNLPAHAFHSSNKTTLIEAKETFKKFTQFIPKGKEFSIISHSFGSAVVGYGLSELDLHPKHLVFLTSPNKMTDIFEDYKRFIKLGNNSYSRMIKKTNKVLGERIENVTISKKLQKANYGELHLFHDKFDKIIPFSNSTEMHQDLPKSKLLEFEHIGHYRMLWNKDLIQKVMTIDL